MLCIATFEMKPEIKAIEMSPRTVHGNIHKLSTFSTHHFLFISASRWEVVQEFAFSWKWRTTARRTCRRQALIQLCNQLKSFPVTFSMKSIFSPYYVFSFFYCQSRTSVFDISGENIGASPLSKLKLMDAWLEYDGSVEKSASCFFYK